MQLQLGVLDSYVLDFPLHSHLISPPLCDPLEWLPQAHAARSVILFYGPGSHQELRVTIREVYVSRCISSRHLE